MTDRHICRSGQAAEVSNAVDAEAGTAPPLCDRTSCLPPRRGETAHCATLVAHALQAAPEYDTFGSTAAEVARRAAETDAAGRAGAALSSLMPDELLAPVAESMGKTALRELCCAGYASHMSWLPASGMARVDMVVLVLDQAIHSSK